MVLGRLVLFGGAVVVLKWSRLDGMQHIARSVQLVISAISSSFGPSPPCSLPKITL